MSYINKQALIAAIGEQELLARTDRERNGTIDDQVLNTYISEAESEVNGYLRGGGYTVPLSAPVDPIIPRLCADVLRYHLWRGANAPQEVEDRYKAAVGRLRDIQRGGLALALASTDATASGVDSVTDSSGNGNHGTPSGSPIYRSVN